MSKKDLLIVESPTKAHTISRLLKGKVKVVSSRGHIVDLPKSRLGVDIENGFEPEYIKIRGKAAVINELKSAAKKAKTVYIGCDPDREGEAIAFSVAQEVKNGAAIRRVLFYEITPKGIEEAFSAPGEIDFRKVDAHRARRVLDRLVGYLVSPLLWRTVRAGKSAGRVQTVALRTIVEREREIAHFKPEEFWVVKAIFARKTGERFETQLVKVRNQPFKLRDREAVGEVQQGCEKAQFAVSELKTKERHKRPLAPFVTATLLKEAVQLFKFSSAKTMRIAQRLFEGVDLKDETVGLITYPRTDSFRVAEEMIGQARDLILKIYGAEYLPEKPRHYPDRKGTQGAHEAIRPTRLDLTPERVKQYLSPDEFKIYDLLFRRFLASQMADAVYQLSEVFVEGGDYSFRAEAVRKIFEGFERVYGEPDKENFLPELVSGEELTLVEFIPEQRFTQPPPRYTEATLIKRLEVNGIGRPSTYAMIVPTLIERRYVERSQVKLIPTELGMVVNDILIPRFDEIFAVNFTREMEKDLDRVEEGEENWREVVARFYKPFRERLDRAVAETGEIKDGLTRELTERCPKCGTVLVERWGRFGKFVACANYPKCDYVKKNEERSLDEKCPKCGKLLVERVSRFGKFVACSGYPACDYIKRLPKEPPRLLDEKCPKCGKLLVERVSR
ncbi:MAG: type I DNA topoisomerase, partial [bacterium]